VKYNNKEIKALVATVRMDLENKLEAANIRIEQLVEERDDALRQVTAKTTECHAWKQKLANLWTPSNQEKLFIYVTSLIREGSDRPFR
jgi:hypothetical protein